MNTESVPVTPARIKALAARYRFQQDRLNKAVEDGNDKVMNQAMASMQKVEDEGRELGLTLESILAAPSTQPAVVTNGKLTPSNPPVKGKITGKGPGSVGTPATPASTKPKSVQEAERVADRAKQVAAQKAGEGKVPGATRTKKDKGPVKMRPCLDGCGVDVPGNFKMGHDAKLKSLILKIERGEEDQSVVPDIVQDLISFKKGEKEIIRSGDGKKVLQELQTWICTEAPVRFPGRPEVKLTVRSD